MKLQVPYRRVRNLRALIRSWKSASPANGQVTNLFGIGADTSRLYDRRRILHYQFPPGQAGQRL
jgi:hypothetical protein